MKQLSNRKRFPCLLSLRYTWEGLGEFMGLHNCQEYSQPLECLYQAMEIQENSFLLLLYINFPETKLKTLCYGTD